MISGRNTGESVFGESDKKPEQGISASETRKSVSGDRHEKPEPAIPGEEGIVSETRGIFLGLKSRYYWISAAAVILILLGIFLDIQIHRDAPLEVRQDTYEDPYIAYAEARKVLYMVSEKMNAGRKPLKNIEKLDEGVNYMHPVFSFGAGIRHLEHLGTIEKTRKKLSK